MHRCSLAVIFVLIISPVFPKPFLQNILAPSSTTHISDFRQRPRSDSRADRMDGSSPPTIDHPKTMEDLYMDILGKIIGVTRQQFERLVDQIQEKQQIRQLRQLDSTPSSLVDFKELRSDKNREMKASRLKAFQKKYFSSLLSAIGLGKLQRSRDSAYLSKMMNTAGLIINPIFDVWHSIAERQLKLKSVQRSVAEEAQINEEEIPEKLPQSDEPMDSVDEDDTKTKLKSIFTNGFFKYRKQIPREVQNDSNNLSDIPFEDNTNGNDLDLDVDFPIIEGIDDQSDGSGDGKADDSENTNLSENFDVESSSIFLLEMIGTIAGLTWGAFNHLQHLLVGN